jgi:hypothetical protein
VSQNKEESLNKVKFFRSNEQKEEIFFQNPIIIAKNPE